MPKCAVNRGRNYFSAILPALFWHNLPLSLKQKSSSHLDCRKVTMKEKFWLCKRGRVFYLCDSETGKRASLHTQNQQEAQRMLRARIESAGNPSLGLAMARAYLTACDKTLLVRTWSDVMEHYCSQGQPQTQALRRRRLKSSVFHSIRQRKLLETTSDHFLTVLKSGGVFVQGVMRSLQNLAPGWVGCHGPFSPPSSGLGFSRKTNGGFCAKNMSGF